MLRTLGWIFGACLLLLAVAVISAGSDSGLLGMLREKALRHSDAGLGFQDGALVFQRSEPPRVTVEQLPSLKGRRLGRSYHNDPLLARMSWYGVSLRETLAACLDLPPGRVLGDERLDAIWLDVDAGHSKGLFESGLSAWDEEQSIVQGAVLDAYGLTLGFEQHLVPVRVLSPGPGWARHLEHGDPALRRVRQDDALIMLEGGRVSSLLRRVQPTLGIDIVEGLDPDASCTLELKWTEGDLESLRHALAQQLDLHVHDREQLMPVAVVGGVPTPPAHLR